MTKEEAVKAARAFATSQAINVGDALNVLYDPVTRLDEFWVESLPIKKFKWVVLFDRLDDPQIDPGTALILVDDQTGRAVFGDNL